MRKDRLLLAASALAFFFAAASSCELLAAPKPQYVESSRCRSCHAAEYAQWLGSQHRVAMAKATAHSVLGDFDGKTLARSGTVTRFFRRHGQFYIHTAGPDGKPGDYRVEYTFGVYPLQQYLIKFPDGRLQVPSAAWDARPRKDGGQRWFDLDEESSIGPTNELYWTRPSHNWNYMCADCHSTHVRKNYDPATNSFHTRFSEISVGCEACHGPGSRHLEWAARRKDGKQTTAYLHDGLTVELDERQGVSWHVDPVSGTPVRSRPRQTDREIQVCAQCHSRRGQIAGDYRPGKPFLDDYMPAFLNEPLYYADGQQRAEVYKWGSFLQSRMYAHGVTCSDCHNPHTARLREAGNALCTRCHVANRYNTPRHFHHRPGSKGATCVACHMPPTTYMAIDPRHDHSIRVPRPDQSVRFGVPNACNNCHSGRSPRWAAAEVRKWYGHNPQGYQRFAAAFAAADAGEPMGQARLLAVVDDVGQPAIVRASALTKIDPAAGDAVEVLGRATHDASALVRLGALRALAAAPARMRVDLAVPLLSDPVRSVRISAAEVLSAVPASQLGKTANHEFEKAAAEYVASRRYDADRPDARVDLGNFFLNRGRLHEAESEFRTAIRLDTAFAPAYANLADFYRLTGDEEKCRAVLQKGLEIAPDDASLHYALGLALVRVKQGATALTEFKKAARLAPDDPHLAYVYGVALWSTGQEDAALKLLEKTISRYPYNRQVLQALASFHAQRGERALAQKYVDRLQALSSPAGQRQ